MNTLITGGSGLLGSALNIKNSFKPSSKELNLLNYQELKTYIINNNIEKIIHCAALVGGVHANKDLIYDFFSKNLEINLNILNACKEFKLNNSIFILSTCVFPAEAEFPLTENLLHDGEPHNTNYGYAYAKRMLEVGSRTLNEQYGIITTCIIPCNFYGPNDNHHLDYGHVIPSLIHKCHIAKETNSDFIIWGSGIPEREFIYVNDLANVVETISEDQTYSNKQYPNKIIVSSGISTTISKIANLVAKEMNFKGNIVYDRSMPDGILRKPTDTKVFNNLFPNFNWTSIEDGIKESVNYFNKNYPKVRK
jgi:GDP-L-fucose synthase